MGNSIRRFCLAALAASVAAAPALAQAPDRLSDADFWRIFSTLSEPGGTFTTENFTSNEVAVGQVAAALRAAGKTGGAYIGVGPEQNFTYIAALEPKVAFIVDIRRQAAMQQLMFKALFELSATRAEFIERLFAFPAPLGPQQSRDAAIHDIWRDYLLARADSTVAARHLAAITNHLTVTHTFAFPAADLATLAHVYRSFVKTGPSISYLTGMPAAGSRSANFASLTMTVDSAAVPRSFLASEKNFAVVKDLQSRNMIVPIVGDFAGAQALRAIGTWLREHGTTVNAFYVSNVEQYLFRPVNKTVAFYDNVAALPLDNSSLLLRSGFAGSVTMATNPFTPPSDSVARLFIDHQRRPAVASTPPAALCPALEYLSAFKKGLVTVYADAEKCVR